MSVALAVPMSSPDLRNNNRGWNNVNEQLVVDWGEKSKVLKWLHDYESRWFMRANFKVGIMAIVLSTYAGAAAFINVDCGTALAYTVGSSGLGAAILGGIRKFLQLDEIGLKHSQYSHEYNGISELIEYELSHYRNEREHAKIFVNKIRDKYNKLTINAPIVSESTIEAFKKHFKHIDIAMPDIATNTINPIVPINENNSNNNIKNEFNNDKV